MVRGTGGLDDNDPIAKLLQNATCPGFSDNVRGLVAYSEFRIFLDKILGHIIPILPLKICSCPISSGNYLPTGRSTTLARMLGVVVRHRPIVSKFRALGNVRHRNEHKLLPDAYIRFA